MKNKIYLLASLFAAVLTLGSCSDFLDETPNKSGSAYIYHMDQLYGLTGGLQLYLGQDASAGSTLMGVMCPFMTEQYFLGDGIGISPDYFFRGGMDSPTRKYDLYCWGSDFMKTQTSASNMTWQPAWERIYTFNTVLENMDKVIQTTAAIRNQVEGEARFGRAFYHFMLLTQYCRWQEDAPGIGYREGTEPGAIPERQTVGYTLGRIYEDLQLAQDALTKAGRTEFDFEHNTRPTVPTVQAFRARVDLYRGNYESALTNAGDALKGHNELADFQQDSYYELSSSYDIQFKDQNGNVDESKTIQGYTPKKLWDLNSRAVAEYRELFLPCMSCSSYAMAIPISESFYNLFTDKVNDSRWKYFYNSGYSAMYASHLYTENNGGGISWETQQWLQPSDLCTYMRFIGQWGTSFIVGMTTAEMYLIQAECLARKGQAGDAAGILKTLRRTRFSDLTAADNIGGSVQEVLDERSREMGPFWRFFDIKRLNGAENAGIEIRRKILADPADPTSVTELVIPANDPRWALPFNDVECQLMGWEQNEGWK